jgi:hypothetical protein
VADEIDLKHVAQLIQRVLSDIGMLRLDITVTNSMVGRQDATMTVLLAQLHAIHQQIKRMNDRVHKLEDRQE